MSSKRQPCPYGEEHSAIRLVFVHGFGGDPVTTWGQFPALLADDPDLPTLCIKSWGYLSKLFRRCPGVEKIAEQFATFLGVGQGRPEHIILVGHSIGGIMLLQSLVAEMLHDQAKRYPLSKVERIALFATPLAGDLVQRVIRRLISSPVGFLARHVWKNRQLIDLYNIELITKLSGLVVNRIYDTNAGRSADSRRHIPIHTFVADRDRVVTEVAVRAWFERPPPRLIPETNHATIKLPRNRKAIAYEALRDVVNEVVHPWFHKLARLARNSKNPKHETAMAELARAYERATESRLSATRGSRWWNASTKEHERAKFLALALKEASLRPGAPIADVLNKSMDAYRRARLLRVRKNI